MANSTAVDPVQLAWASGIFEGEGSISIDMRTRLPFRTPIVRLSVSSTDEDVLRKFAAVLSTDKHVTGPRYSSIPNRKPLWHWRVSTEKALPIIDLMYPFLGERRRLRADEAKHATRFFQPMAIRARNRKGRFING